MTSLKAKRPTVMFEEPSRSSKDLAPLATGLIVVPLSPAQTAEADERSWIKVKFTPPGGTSMLGWVIRPHFDEIPDEAPAPIPIDGFVRTCFLATVEFNALSTTAPYFVSPNYLIAQAQYETKITNANSVAAEGAVGPLQVTPAEWKEFLAKGGDFAKDLGETGFEDPMRQIYGAVYRAFADAKAFTDAGTKSGKGPDPKGNPFLPTYLDLFHTYLLDSPSAALAVLDASESDKNKKMDVLLKDLPHVDHLFKVRGTLLGTKDAAKTVGEFVTLTEQALTDALKQALELIKQHAPDELPAEGDAPTVTLSAGIPTNVASTFGGINIPFGELKSPPLAERFWPLITDHPQAMVITYLSTAEEVVGGPGRNFFANRRGGKRHHVGLDIYCKEGDVVVACAPGRIVNFYRFYRTSTGEESFALFVEHDGVVVNYGEVRQDARQKFGWKIGDNVTGGQKIAEVSSTKMIHLETYVPGTKQNSSWMAGDAKPASLLNPTMLLLTLASGAKRIGVNGTTTVTAGSAKPTDGAGGAMTDEDLLTMARTMYGEARNQPAAGQEAVGHVIMNRVRRNKSFYGGNNITKVCKMGNGGQFNCWMPSDSNFSLIRNLVRGANPMFNQCLEIAEKVIRGQVADNTKDSTHYLNPDTVASMPSWATKSRETVKIKDHQFYGHVDD